MKRRLLSPLLLAVLAANAAQAAEADAELQDETVAQAPQTLEERIAQLEQQIAVLQRRAETAAEDAAAAKPNTPVVASGPGGFSLTSGDGGFQLKLRGYIQADSHFLLDDDAEAGTDSFQLRRVRPIFEGSLGKVWAFRFMPDFGLGSTSVQDAYVEGTFAPALKLRVGKFKPPVGLERLQSGSEMKWVERGLPTNLVPNRDVGIQVAGDLYDGTASYALGWFNGVGDGGSGDVDAADSKEWAARLMLQPFINGTGPLQNLSFGIAGTVGDKEGAGDLGRFRTPVQLTFFQYGFSSGTAVVADGSSHRVSPQFSWTWRAFSLFGEYVRSQVKVARGTAHASLSHDAWQLAGSWVLTGEEATFKNVSPTRPFALGEEGWGAFELTARAAGLDVDDDVFPTFADSSKYASEARSWAVGLNWYPSRNVRASLDYERTQFDGGAAGGADRDDEKALFSRLQVSW